MTTELAAVVNVRWLAALGLGMVHSLWQATMIAAAAALILREIRGASRYVVAYAALMLIPVACAVTVWQVSAGASALVVLPFAGWELFASWIGCAWLAGIGAASLRLAAGWLRLHRLRRSAIAVPDSWQSAVDAMCGRLGIARAVRLVETHLADVPGVIGWISPILLFPTGLLAGLPPAHVQLILAHELAHVRRNDYLWNLVQTAVETVFFFHPAVWWLSNRVRRERELYTDDVVVTEFADGRLYAEALIGVERYRARRQTTLAIAAGGGDLLARIERLIEGSPPRRPRAISSIGACALLALAGIAAASATASGAPIPTAAVSSAWLGATLGLVVGIRHALEPDHLVAVSTLVANEHSAARGARLGLAWGLGHTLTLLVAAGGLALVRVTVPEAAVHLLEAGVGVMLVVLGAQAVRSALKTAVTGPRTRHSHGSIVHVHETSAAHVHLGPVALACRPLLVGMVHGIAGSGALAAMAMATLPTLDVQIAFIGLFGLGSTIGMAALSGVAGLPLARLARKPVACAAATALAGVISVLAGLIWIGGGSVLAQGNRGGVTGHVVDTTGGRLPGVTVVLSRPGASPLTGLTDATGKYEFVSLPAGDYDLTFTLINFARHTRRDVHVASGETAQVDVVLHLTLSADVTVTGWRSFTNLADVADPASSLVGIAGAASEGAITSRQILERPIMRAGEVLETVPGLVISQHSGEGKANQYYLRGFNLDHGTDFATTIAGIPVNMPTHAHGHGYTDANFLIPELVSGVQFKKGPYYAEEGDFSAAGAVNVNYVNFLERPIVEASGGGQGWARVLGAVSPRVGNGHLLAALELNHNDGPWTLKDDYRKINGVVRYSEGNSASGFSVTGLVYRGEWNATDQVPQRAIDTGVISRFGHIDPTNGGKTHRYSLSADSQWTSDTASTRANAYVVNYALNLFSNFTYFLDDPENGDQFEQEDRRNIVGGRITHRRLGRWANRSTESLLGAQVRYDRIGPVGLYHTRARQRLSATREDRIGQTSLGVFAQNEYHWSNAVRTTVGVRGDVFNFDVDGDPANSGSEVSGLVSPKGSIVLGPWNGTELYGNAGAGFHSNDARGSTTTRDPVTGDVVEPTTPLVRAKGAEFGIRTVKIPKVQMTVAAWWLAIDSELLFIGDAGTTEAGRPSRRFGVEWATYARPHPWVGFDADIGMSRGRFTDDGAVGDHIPGSVESVISLGAVIDNGSRVFGGIRLRHFGGRSLVEDDSVRSEATTLVNAQAGVRLGRNTSVVLEMFNLFDAESSDIDYFYTSRLLGEPDEGVDDIHLHPALPRSARLSLRLGF
jgi:beta-lactamase regulating signal transducer with metallopeptidase domain